LDGTKAENTRSNTRLEQRTLTVADAVSFLSSIVAIRKSGTAKQTNAGKAKVDWPQAELNMALTTQMLKGRFNMVSSFFTEAKQADHD
jgi:hypothetical protein